MKSVTALLICLSLILGTAAIAETIMIDSFLTPIGTPDNHLRIWGDQPFQEWTDIAPAGAIGDRHAWYRGWDFQYPGFDTVNWVTFVDYSSYGNGDGPALNFGGYDFNHEWAFDYGIGNPLDLNLAAGYAFSIDLYSSDIPMGNPMTVTVQTGTGEGSYTVTVPYWDDYANPVQLMFPFELFSGTPDWSDIDVITLNFYSADEFGPDAFFDTFVAHTQVVATEEVSWGSVKSLYR